LISACADADDDDPVEQILLLAGMSRSTLAERFQTVLCTSPIKYVREWRLWQVWR